MTTPPTPADWYPDPEGGGGLRYWDGAEWTEHRAPAPSAEPAAPVDDVPASEQPTSVVSLPDHATTVISTEPPAPTPEPTPEPLPAWEQPTDAPAFGAPPSFGDPPSYGPPPGSGGGGSNKKTIIIFASAVGALLLILVLLLVYAFVIRDYSPGVTVSSSSSSATTSSSKSSSTKTRTSVTETKTTAPPSDREITEGDFTFSVASSDIGDSVTSPLNDNIEKTANGQYVVVYLNVGNTGSSQLTFLGTLQKLNTDTGSYSPDDEASFYLGGGVVTIDPGDQVEVPVAFDVSTGTTPDSIIVVGTPGEAGSLLPL